MGSRKSRYAIRDTRYTIHDTRYATRDEWRWVAGMGLLALLLTSLPYLVAWAGQTPERHFGGFLILLDDGYSYLAKMRLGATGGWLFHIVYTSEPSAGTLFFPFHIMLGKIAALFPGDLVTRMVTIYHAARIACGFIMMLVVYRFLAEFTAQTAVRRLAWLIVTFSGGFGWLLAAFGQVNWLGSPPLDFYLPEGFGLLTLFGFPHIAVAQTLLSIGLLHLLKAWRGAALPDVLYAGLAWLLMGLIVPFYVLVAWAVTGASWIVLCLRERRPLWRAGWLGGSAALLSSPIVLYSAWIFATDPVYAAWSAQNLILSPHPLHYLVAYGAPLLLALFAVGEAWRDRRPAWFALTWVAITPVLLYLPFNLQRRLVEGAQVPLALLAAWGAVRLWQTGQAQRRARTIRRIALLLLLATMCPSTLVTLAGSAVAASSRPPIMFRDVAEITALDWLAQRAHPEDVVLSSYNTGNYLPARVSARVFLGHGFETMDAADKESQVARFYDAATDDAWRYNFLAWHGIDYVFWGPAERRVGGYDLRDVFYLRLIYDEDGYAIFKVD